MSIGSILRGVAVGGLGAGSAGALGAGVAIPVAVHATGGAVDVPAEEAPEPEETVKDEQQKPKEQKDHLGARVRVWNEEGLRGRELAARIHADLAERGRGPDAEHGKEPTAKR